MKKVLGIESEMKSTGHVDKASEYSIVIPVVKLEGNLLLENLLSKISGQTLLPKEVHLVVGDPRQGRAINFGAGKINSRYFATLDDDSIIDDKDLFRKLLDAMDADPGIGIGGASCLIPKDASPLQKRAMREIPRRFFPVQPRNTPSDMVQHPCLIMETDFFRAIGGEDEDLVRGLDPVLRKKARDAGKNVSIIADTWVYHGIPDSLAGIAKMYYRNGRGSGFASRNFPDRIIELSDGYDNGFFIERRPLPFRIARRVWNLALCILGFEFVRLVTEIAYAAGLLKEYFFPRYSREKPQVKSIESSEIPRKGFKLFVHKVKLV